MASPVYINVDFFPEYHKKISVIPVIEVPYGSTIYWRLNFRNFAKFRYDKIQFSFYFPYHTPFYSGDKNIKSKIDAPIQVIKGGEVRNEGEYKYGIKVENTEEDKVIYDEDPYIIVLPPFKEYIFENIPNYPQRV